MQPILTPGQKLAQGVGKHLKDRGLSYLEEFVPKDGLRVDVIGIDGKGQIWIIECKSSRVDYVSDHKWQNYLPFCDRFFFAVDRNFAQDILPADTGLIMADEFGAEIIRFGPQLVISAARRKKLITKFALNAADRLNLQRENLRSKRFSLVPKTRPKNQI